MNNLVTELDTYTVKPNVAVSPNVKVRQEEILKLLSRLERSSIPTFYNCGIIDTDIGYYQLARLEDGKRLMLFALNLEDLQLKEYPGLGELFAHPAQLFGVNVYDDETTADTIYLDLQNHQAALRRIMREEYTLARTSTGIYQSRAISYALQDAALQTTSPKVGNQVHVDSFVDALQDHNYAPTYRDETAAIYDRMRHPRIRLTVEKSIGQHEAVPYILEHFAKLLGRLTEGKEGIQLEDSKFSLYQRLALRAKIYGARLLDNIRKATEENLHELRAKKVSTTFEWAKRIWAFIRIPVVIHESMVELALSLWEAFRISYKREAEAPPPAALEPYVREHALHTRLNAHLYPLRAEKMEMAKPLDLKQSELCPLNAQAQVTDPFSPKATDCAPSLGSVRTPLGSILMVYPNTSMMLQANGVWLVLRHDTNKTYVGYNKQLDTSAKPTPSPTVAAWLDQKKLLCYTPDTHHYEVGLIPADEAHAAFDEIIAAGDGHFLDADKPELTARPYIIPAREPPMLMIHGKWVPNPKAQPHLPLNGAQS